MPSKPSNSDQDLVVDLAADLEVVLEDDLEVDHAADLKVDPEVDGDDDRLVPWNLNQIDIIQEVRNHIQALTFLHRQ